MSMCEQSKWLRVVAMAVSILFVLTACGNGDTEGDANRTDEGTGADELELRIGWVAQNFTNPAIVDMVEAGRDEVSENYPNVTLVAEDSEDLEDQISKAETLLAQGIDVLGLQPWEGGAILPIVEQANSAGVDVFLTQDDAPGAVDDGLAVTYIASDELEGGRLVGEFLIDALGDSGEVALIEGAPGDSPAINRTEGFLEATEGGGIEVVAQNTANWARDEGLQVTTDVLTAQPGLDAIFAHNDEMALGALEALRARGLDEDVILVGYNGTCIGLEATIKGDFQAEGILFLDTVGREFIRAAVAHSQGEEVEPRIQPPILVLSAEEMNAALEGEQELEEEGLLERLEAAEAGDC